MIFEEIPKVKKTFLLDEYPKTFSQIDILHQAAGKPSGIIFLNLPEDACVTRLLKRAAEQAQPG